jgi:hypothetical protein
MHHDIADSELEARRGGNKGCEPVPLADEHNHRNLQGDTRQAQPEDVASYRVDTAAKVVGVVDDDGESKEASRPHEPVMVSGFDGRRSRRRPRLHSNSH